MHIREFTRRLTPWLTLYLLVASIGLPLQRVYCACIGESELTLPGSEHDCESHAPQITGHDHQRVACCMITKDCRNQEAVDHNCSSSEVVLAALDADFLPGTVADYAAVPGLATLPAWPDYRPLAVMAVAKTRPIRGPDPPVKPSGRELLVAHQTYLI